MDVTHAVYLHLLLRTQSSLSSPSTPHHPIHLLLPIQSIYSSSSNPSTPPPHLLLIYSSTFPPSQSTYVHSYSSTAAGIRAWDGLFPGPLREGLCVCLDVFGLGGVGGRPVLVLEPPAARQAELGLAGFLPKHPQSRRTGSVCFVLDSDQL